MANNTNLYDKLTMIGSTHDAFLEQSRDDNGRKHVNEIYIRALTLFIDNIVQSIFFFLLLFGLHVCMCILYQWHFRVNVVLEYMKYT